jgi:hypothetical protein
MADHADDEGDGDDVFVYMGGDQRVPDVVTDIPVHKSVKIIRGRVFWNCGNLLSIEMHDGVDTIKWWAFYNCTSLRRIKLSGVRVIEERAFSNCTMLENVEFGDELETIGFNSFSYTALRNIKLSKVRTIGNAAFQECEQLTEVKLSKHLETIGQRAFRNCPRLRRIAIPLNENLLCNNAFTECDDLSKVDLVGGIHKTISSLLLESWRNEMNDEIGRINRDLPTTPADDKTTTIRLWVERVIRRIEHYKAEHYRLLKEFTTLLELALWKAKLYEEFGFEEALSKEVSESNTEQRKPKSI